MNHGRTVGFEEEFLLVDATGVPTPEADLVLGRLLADLDPGESERFKPELQKVQIESVSGVHTGMKGLRSDLSTARQRLAAAADQCDLAVLPVGTAPACGAPEDVTTHSRYERIHQRYGEMTRSYTACGAHVHVGVDSAEQAVAVVNHLRPWLPILVAIGANSPFHNGRDSGYSSWRIAEQARFPGAGLPPFSRSADEYRERIAILMECGVLIDDHMSFWMARPSDAYPTVEVRAVDTAATVDDAVLQALLTRGLVHTAIRKLEAGIEGPPIDDQTAAAAVWAAARYGLDGPAIDPIEQRQVPAVQMVKNLTEWIADELEEVGDTAEATRLLTAVHQHGTGATRQRIAAASGLPGLVESFRLTSEFALAELSLEAGA
ncbi:glutamate--cysteine ligase [Nocardia sp. NPDC006630]|uniref:carboxylate-amine ligase n=1 Tax=Nocardia sp. NPDC006630 TaxID=3157181 RepID=UPI0033B128D6